MSSIWIISLALALCACAAAQVPDGAIPELLVASDGTPITSPQLWETKRRPEIIDLLQKYVYGRTPIGRPEKLKFEVIATRPDAFKGTAVGRQIEITYAGPGGEGKINLILFVPIKRSGPVPAFLLINNPRPLSLEVFWPVQEIISRGYATAAFTNTELGSDSAEKAFTTGVFKAFEDPTKPRRPDGWGAIGAWAWGASRCLDYLGTDADIDAKRVAVVGHSRGGKTALWAGAQDQRFAMAVSNDSGVAGAALFRGSHEGAAPISHCVDKFGYWFCPNFAQYVGRPEQLPMDQHMLIAAMAPRLVYVASAAEDLWSDPPNEHKACIDASPAWRLYGLPGMSSTTMPAVDSPAQEGTIGYHIRTGKHDLTEYDWQRFMDFADKHLSPSNRPAPTTRRQDEQ